jgi:hypothetical protein
MNKRKTKKSSDTSSDQININKLVSSNFPTNSSQDISVMSLYKSSLNNNKSNNLIGNVHQLIKVREERDNRLKKEIQKIFDNCMDRIQKVNESGILEIVMTIPKSVYGHPNYVSVDAINYIDQKLKSVYMDTEILSDNEIYVSWDNIKQNMENVAKTN